MSRKLILFDVDGTLTEPRKCVKKNMVKFLEELRDKVQIGIVGGSNFEKQKEQLGENILDNFDYIFAENGLDYYKNGDQINRISFIEYIGEYKYKKLVNWILNYLANRLTDIPVKRGTFIEFRSGMINVSPIGRQCTIEERNEFERYDNIFKIREKMISYMKKELSELNLQYSIGGQISFDIFPIGWDKRYCLKYIVEDFDEIYFFGDKTYEGGNDYEIYNDPRVVGYSVNSPNETIEICKKEFLD